MKPTLTSPDSGPKKVRRLPSPDELISQAVEKASERSTTRVEARDEGSKWARLVAEIADGSMSLGEQAAQQFEQDRKDFREQFRFKHDEEE
ncbi:MAG: hypothetical protein WAM82_15935 [Thermoanaerobaculia bacterium]